MCGGVEWEALKKWEDGVWWCNCKGSFDSTSTVLQHEMGTYNPGNTIIKLDTAKFQPYALHISCVLFEAKHLYYCANIGVDLKRWWISVAFYGQLESNRCQSWAVTQQHVGWWVAGRKPERQRMRQTEDTASCCSLRDDKEKETAAWWTICVLPASFPLNLHQQVRYLWRLN